MLHLDDEDDEDFNVKSGHSSKLANLFGGNQRHEDIDDSNRSLIYTPPKQPKKIEIASNTSTGNISTNIMTLIHASAVNVFKFENGKYNSQGKLGAALLGNHDSCTYKLILYTGKQQHITYASINENFKFICQPNNYCSYYDDNRQNWSLMFDSEEEKSTFNKQLVVCKFNCLEKSGNDWLVCVQDLVVANENSLIEAEDNDTIELKYKGWTFDDRNSAPKLFANSESMSKKPFRLKLEAKLGQVLRGMKTNDRRYVMIAFKLREQFSEILENAPTEQVLRYAFELDLIKIRPRKPQKPDKHIDDIPAQTPPNIDADKEKSSEKLSVSGPVKDESQSVKSKSDILSRVARMGGLPILPVKQDSSHLKPEPNDTTDAHNNEQNNTQTKPSPKPRNNSLTANTNQSETLVSNSNSSNKIPETNTNYNTIQTNSTQIPVSIPSSYQIPSYFMTQNTSFDTSLSLLANETRTHNTEVRINLTKIIDKIDLISEKVSDIKNSANSNIPSMPISSIGFMDSAILLSSIQRIVNENNTLKHELDDKTSKLQTLNEKICDLLQQQSGNTSNSSLEIERLLISENRLKRELQVLTEECERFKSKNNDLNKENTELKKTIEELKSDIENNTKRRVSDNSNIMQTKEFTGQVKKMMNDVFRKIMSQVDKNKTYLSEEIVEIVSNSIRSTTLAAIESRSDSQRNSPFHQSVDEIDVNKAKDETKDEAKDESKRPPIPVRKKTEIKQNIDECNDEPPNQELDNNKESSDSVDITNDSVKGELSNNNMIFDEKSKTWKPKIPSNSPPDFEFVYEDSIEEQN